MSVIGQLIPWDLVQTLRNENYNEHGDLNALSNINIVNRTCSHFGECHCL